MLNLNKVNIDLSKKEPINLSKAGDFAEIELKNFHVKMLWKTAIDMDLHVFYQLKEKREKTGLFKWLSSNKFIEGGHVYFADRGNSKEFPYIELDQDAGVGNTAGNNEENITFSNLSIHSHILVAVNIFAEANARFSQFDCKVVLTADGRDFVIPLNSNNNGNWAVIAQIDNTAIVSKLINRSEILTSKPNIENFIKI